MISAGIYGFVLGATLIIAIGAQNAFILRQGLLRQHVFVLCLICAVSDALLIAVGVAGVGAIVSRSPNLIASIQLTGALFLFFYAIISIRRAFHPDGMELRKNGGHSRKSAIAICLAFTFLNPHVYLDTVLLLGGLSSAYQGNERIAYGLGAALASFVWFFALGYGARLLGPYFAKPKSWQVLDCLIAVVMAGLGLHLLYDFVNA